MVKENNALFILVLILTYLFFLRIISLIGDLKFRLNSIVGVLIICIPLLTSIYPKDTGVIFCCFCIMTVNLRWRDIWWHCLELSLDFAGIPSQIFHRKQSDILLLSSVLGCPENIVVASVITHAKFFSFYQNRIAVFVKVAILG